MTDRTQDAPNESAQFADKTWPFAKLFLALVFGIFGFVLLMAEKTTAGSAFVCAALLLFLPFDRLTKNKWLSVGPRAALIAVLCTIAIRSINNTDIVPGQGTTGYAFLDQMSAIFRRFQENTFGVEKAK